MSARDLASCDAVCASTLAVHAETGCAAHAPATLPADPVLPQLPRALNARAMAVVFGSALSGAEVTACAIDRVKYRPRRTCSVSYRLQLRGAGGAAFEQRVSARFCAAGDAPRRHARALQVPREASPAGPDLQCDTGLDMLAWWLPNDPCLPGLRVLADAGRLQAAWQALPAGARAAVAAPSRRPAEAPRCSLPTGQGGERQDPARHEPPVLHADWVQVVPERRACARVTAGAGPGARIFYVKCHADARGALTHARMQALHAGAEARAGRLRTPQPVAWQPADGLHWQRALAGLPLAAVDPEVGPASSAAVGGLLAALHRSPVPVGDDRLDDAGLDAQAHEAAATLGRVCADWQGPAEDIAAYLHDHRALLAGSPQATLHGDLHPANVLVERRSAAPAAAVYGLIDLDSLRIGPAVLELGAWVADALYRGSLSGAPRARSQASIDAFLDAYVQAGGSRPQPRALAWATARQLLVRRAYGAVANLKPGRLAGVPTLLAWAQAIARHGAVDAAWNLQGGRA